MFYKFPFLWWAMGMEKKCGHDIEKVNWNKCEFLVKWAWKDIILM